MLNPGDTLQGRYIVEKVLGEGGMGAVYLARQELLESRVAIKEVLESFLCDSNLNHFKAEARILSSLRHPGLVDLKDFFIENGHPYMVMEFVDGRSLADLV